jgi:hypothetical protein
MRGCFTLIGLVLLLIGVASLSVLIKIGGQSDGPGALLFYIGAAGGLFGGLVVLSSLRSKE